MCPSIRFGPVLRWALLAAVVVPSAAVGQQPSPVVPSVLPVQFASDPGAPLPTVPAAGTTAAARPVPAAPPAPMPDTGPADGWGTSALPPRPMPPAPAGGPALALASVPPATAGPSGPTFDVSWNNGVFFRSADRRFEFHVGGTLHYDAAWYSVTEALELRPGGTGKFNDGVNVRRGRVNMEGTLYEAVDFRFEVELFNGRGFSPAGTLDPVRVATVTDTPGPTHAWITVGDVPLLGNVRVGNQKEWFSLEHLNPHKFLTFMERSYLFDFAQTSAFNNGFTPGVSAFRTWLDDRVFTGAGVYKNTSDLIGVGLGDGQYAFTGRLTGLPVWIPDEQILWHVGGAMSHRDPVDGQVQIRIRNNIRNAPLPLLNLVANTGPIGAASQTLFNLETAAVCGPVTFQAEYVANVINGASVGTRPVGGNGDLYFGACYVEALCFLTGESRPWNATSAFFDRVRPLRPVRFRPADGSGYGYGAWEVGVRYSYVDLSNKQVQAGRLDSVTFGVNWYLNANAKFQFNYDITQRTATPNLAQGTVHAFGTRCAIDF